MNDYNDRFQIQKYQGCTNNFRTKLCFILGIEKSKLEISYTDVTDQGCIIHFVQIMNKDDTILTLFALYDSKYPQINIELQKMYRTKTNIDSQLVLHKTMDDKQDENEFVAEQKAIQLTRYQQSRVSTNSSGFSSLDKQATSTQTVMNNQSISTSTPNCANNELKHSGDIQGESSAR